MSESHPCQKVDMDSWKRRRHFALYSASACPYTGVTADVDVTDMLAACRRGGARFFTAFMYVAMAAVNAVENFRYRIAPDGVVLYDAVDPSFTVLDSGDDLFYIATVRSGGAFGPFAAAVTAAEQAALAAKNLGDPRRDLVYVTCVPWVSFTELAQPLDMDPADAIPRLAWGKYRASGDRTLMPFSVIGHHGLLDGVHFGMLFDNLHEEMRQWTKSNR